MLDSLVRAVGNELGPAQYSPAIPAALAGLVGISAANADAAENNCVPASTNGTCIATQISAMMTPLLRSFAAWVVVSIRQFSPAGAQQVFPFASIETGQFSRLF
jgi:hypothetical protein